MLPDSGNTSPGEIVMTGVLGLYYGDMVISSFFTEEEKKVLR